MSLKNLKGSLIPCSAAEWEIPRPVPSGVLALNSITGDYAVCTSVHIIQTLLAL